MAHSDGKDVAGVIASFEAALRRTGLASGGEGSPASAVRGPAKSPPAASAKRSLADLANFVEHDLVGRCITGDSGQFAGQTWLRLDGEHVAALQQLSAALKFLAPYDDAIRRTIKRARSDGET